MDEIQIKDKVFTPSISAEEIQKQVKRVADELNRDMEGKNPIFLGVLNGSFIFAADLYREITVPSEISFVKMASYQGTTTTGKVKELLGLSVDVTDRTVVIVEDIVDTGLTMQQMIASLKKHNPKDIQICTLLVKPDKLKVDLDIKYVAFNIPNDFILGYGLDYDGYGRNLKQIYTVVE
ncbi:MAG: hypoxanthine phosphoribosyltransferase [Bacteroidaceae bacterium]|nr:hypoxanthine phosphoribosyltransferase [Bacteroidaceae bacterium]